MIRRLTFLAIALATAALVVGFVLSNVEYGIFLSLFVGMGWVVAIWFNHFWAASLGLLIFVSLAVLGAANEYYAIFDAFAVVAALSAWDLSRYGQRLRLVENDPSWTDANRRHVRRLLLVNGIGLLIAAIAITIQIGGPFFLAWFLAIGAVVALFILVIRIAKLTQ